jgi:repressor of nif and glnA expression
MLNLSGIIANGEGSIGASFREMPEESRDSVVEVSTRLESIGLGGFLKIGYPGQSLCEIPVSEGTYGSLIKGGLNPVAILEESGIEAHSTALSSFIDVKQMTSYTDFRSTVGKYL